MMLWSVKPPHLLEIILSVTLTLYGTLVITRPSTLFPRVGFVLSCECQEVVVKGFNKGYGGP